MEKDFTNIKQLLEMKEKENETLKKQLNTRKLNSENKETDNTNNNKFTNITTENLSNNSMKKRTDYSEMPRKLENSKSNYQSSRHNETQQHNNTDYFDDKKEIDIFDPRLTLNHNSQLQKNDLLKFASHNKASDSLSGFNDNTNSKINNVNNLSQEIENQSNNFSSSKENLSVSNNNTNNSNIASQQVLKNDIRLENNKFNQNLTHNLVNPKKRYSEIRIQQVGFGKNDEDYINTDNPMNKSFVDVKLKSTPFNNSIRHTQILSNNKLLKQFNNMNTLNRQSSSINMNDLEEYYRKFSHLYSDATNIPANSDQKNNIGRLDSRRKTALPQSLNSNLINNFAVQKSNSIIHRNFNNNTGNENNLNKTTLYKSSKALVNPIQENESNNLHDYSNIGFQEFSGLQTNNHIVNQSFNNLNSDEGQNTVFNFIGNQKQDIEKSFNLDDESRLVNINNLVHADANINYNTLNPGYINATQDYMSNENGDTAFYPYVQNLHSNISDIKSQLTNYEKVYDNINKRIDVDNKDKVKKLEQRLDDLNNKLKEEQDSKEKLKEFHERDIQMREESFNREKSLLENNLKEELRKTIIEYEKKNKDLCEYFEKVSVKFKLNIQIILFKIFLIALLIGNKNLKAKKSRIGH